MSTDDLQQRYAAAAHAVQSGIAMTMSLDGHVTTADGPASPKHLRVGVDTSKAEQGALAQLLIDKGVFTQEEYFRAIVEGLEAEKIRHEALLSQRLGATVTLS
jgi:hypothetical protein